MSVPTEQQHSTSPNGIAMEQPRILDHFRTFVTTITPARATEILETRNWQRQRQISPRWVDILRMAILKGEITFLTLVFGEYPNGSQVLVDGQHRLKALGLTEKTLQANVVVHRVMNDAELGALYLKYDRSKARGPEVGLRAMGVFEESTVPEGFVRRLGAAASIVNGGFDRARRVRRGDLIERTHAVHDWLPEIETYYGILKDTTKEIQSKLLRAAVGAVALATIKHQPGTAEPFWTGVATQAMLAADDPRFTLMNWLRANNATMAKRGVAEIVYSLYVANAWNAFFHGRTLKQLKSYDISAPVRIDGTPYGREPS